MSMSTRSESVQVKLLGFRFFNFESARSRLPNADVRTAARQRLSYWVLSSRCFFLPTHLHTNQFAANDNLHAPVLFPPGQGAVVGERVGLAEPLGCDRVRRQSLGNQELASCVGSLLRELHVEIWRACIVRVAFNR
jgi:hypothetical protein